MITSIEPKKGSFILLVGPRSLNTMMQTVIALLGEQGPLRILDGGNRFYAYTVARMVQGHPEVLNRLTISRAFTCYQVLSLLECTRAINVPFVVLDLLNTFYDEAVKIEERKRLLGKCLSHLERLDGQAGGVVSVHPPAVPSQGALEMLGMLQGATKDLYCVEPVAPAPEPLRLF